MRLSYSLGSLLTIEQILDCAKILKKYSPDVVWIPETWGMENFSMLSMVSQIVPSKIGSSIINVYSRSPALVAMGAATIDTISNGRLILGLGTSSEPIVKDWHGQEFEKPVSRIKEYIEIIRLALSGKKVDYNGKFFSLKNFSLLIKPPRKHIPIYLAAVNQKMTDLTWQIADGAIFYLRPISELRKTVEKMQRKRRIDVTCQLVTCMSDDSEKAKTRAKKTLAFYVSVGKIYRDFLSKNGFQKESANIFDEYKKSGLKSNYEFVSDSMLNQLAICGTPNECIKQLQKFRDVGIDLPIIQFNPIDDVFESFKLLVSTLSDAN
ncbi:MAG: LLM class flavin-dependent oxidoreductase [Thaumarchaeota archaeon]|nr:LLM class flavin-dependent oxidoreductase [Nitrososphaerota archaeon]